MRQGLPAFSLRAVACAILLSSASCSGPAARTGQEILAAAGVKGGLVVHLGCGSGRLTASLRPGEQYLVQGLETDPEQVASARKYLKSLGCYGPVSVDLLSGRRLPYTDNMVNMLVVERSGEVPPEEMMRVVAPLGVIMRKDGDGWVRTVKPWPGEIDEWTHYLHGPDNNAVARDRVVGPPAGLQWLSDPIHLRSHEHLNSVSGVVSSQGRLFYILDEGPTSAVIAPPRWRLIARDAFSGVLLWKHDLGPWEGHFRLFRSGPAELARRLVADGNRVYASLGYGAPLAAFDAATGVIVRTYEATAGALELIYRGGQLFVVVGDIDLTPPADPAKIFYPKPPPRRKGIVALEAAAGKVLWTRRDDDTSELMPTTLAVSGDRLFYQNPAGVVCLNAADGEEIWRAERTVFTRRLSWGAPVLVVAGDVVLSADGSTGGLPANVPRGSQPLEWVMSDTDIRLHPPGSVVAFSARDGNRLWTGQSLQGFCNPGDLFVVDGKVWCGADVSQKQALLDRALDLKSGEVVSMRPQDGWPVGSHTRCYRNKATEKFLILGDVGVEFVDLNDWSWNANPWVRGTCQYGVMPCNGLLYVPPDSCACRPDMRLHGFSAMAPQRAPEPEAASGSQRLQRGPAFEWARGSAASAVASPAGSWPTYRHDPSRSGRTDTRISSAVSENWTTKIGGRLSSITVAGGTLFVAQIDTHTVFALDSASGRVRWSRTVAGPVDSPPTILGSLVLFGCRDGNVYCLRQRDGELAWRFRAGPVDRRMVAMDRIESVWPVHGSVLIRDGRVWFAAGRSPFLDGGIHVFALDPISGEVVVQQTVFSRGEQEFRTSAANNASPVTPPGLPDILSADDGLVYMRWMGFDDKGNIRDVQPHLFSATGFLDDTWWHRTYWQYGTFMLGGFGGWPRAARQVPAGRIMVVGDDTLFSFDRLQYDSGNGGDVHAGHIGLVKYDYQDSGWIDHTSNPYSLYSVAKPLPGSDRRQNPRENIKWQVSVPLLVRAMIMAGQTLFIAGPDAMENNRGLMNLTSPQPGWLCAVSADDGKLLTRLKLPAGPVFDGMAAAGGRLYLATLQGEIRCFQSGSDHDK